MRTFDFGENKLYASIDFYDKDLGWLEKHTNAIIKNFTKRKLFRVLLELYGQKHGLEGYILLKAHGNVKDEQWVLFDDKELYAVQDWIDEMDGSALALLLWCCNPENHDVHSERSVIMHPRDNVSVVEIVDGGHMRLYVPGEDYLEESSYYRLRKVIDQLR